MLDSFTISNFKPFGKNTDIKLAPITLICGPNSSGKSSIIQALNLIKQTYASQDQGILSLKFNAEIVDLGGNSAVINKHNEDNDLEFRYDFSSSEKQSDKFNSKYSVMFTYTKGMLKKLKIRYEAEKNLNLGPVLKKRKNDIKFKKPSKNKKLTLKNEIEFLVKSKIDDGKKKYFYKATKKSIDNFNNDLNKYLKHPQYKELFKLMAKKGKKDEDLSELKNIRMSQISGFPMFEFKNFLKYKLNDDTTNHALFVLRSWLESYSYIGPLRDAPIRMQRTIGKTSNVGISGANTAEILFKNSEVEKLVNQWFDILGIDYSISTHQYQKKELGESFSLTLLDKRTNIEVSPVDVGIGIFQILPIITQALMPPKQLLSIEQPEIHLHPKLCAELGDFIIETAHINLDPKKRKIPVKGNHLSNKFRYRFSNQWLIETHSELIISRILRRIKEGKISKSDVKILYVHPPKKKLGSIIEEIKISDKGEISEWPGGFFAESFDEIFP